MDNLNEVSRRLHPNYNDTEPEINKFPGIIRFLTCCGALAFGLAVLLLALYGGVKAWERFVQ